MAAELTLGAEEELHLIDLDSWKLAARAPQVLSRLSAANYTAEIQRTTVETNTDVVTSLSGLRDELLRLRRGVIDVAGEDGMGIAAVGTAPRSVFADFELTATGRYGRMQEQYRLLVDEQLICGTQIHVGVSDRDLAVQIAQRVARELPIFLALSASSPFWNGLDTGYASFRTIIWQRWPSAGATGPLGSAAEYDELLSDLIHTGVIADSKMAYFDVRPSSHAPTLELRIADACPIVDDAVLIAGLFRAAVRAAELDIVAGVSFVPTAVPLHRAAMWQAARGGLSSNLLGPGLHPRPIPAERAVRQQVQRLRPQLEELGDYAQVSQLVESVLARGTSADRQRAAFAERGSLDDVVELVVQETHGPAEGTAPATVPLPRYRVRAGDEAIGRGAQPKSHYRAIIDFYSGLDAAALAERHTERDRASTRMGLNFGVEGEKQGFHIDLVPRVISRHEWAELSAGLIQRARAVEAFLEDIYGDQRVLRHGIVTAESVVGSPGWREEALRLPPGTIRAPIMGFDLVRNEFGEWRVLEDNVRAPSGAAYAIAARSLLDTVVPELPRPDGLLDPTSALKVLHDCLLARSPGGTGALLSSGVESSARYEHRALAAGAELLLVEADDLRVDGGRVIHRSTGTTIDALYLRLDGELVDLVDDTGHPIGADVMDVAAAGRVFLANAPGNGVADDKAMYCTMPELIAYYLRERPLLESVPTYRTSDETERQIVLERVGELVTKPVDGQGGNGILIGPTAVAAQVSERRAEILQNPEAWIAQEVVSLSLHPTFSDGKLEPRRVDLRAFVYVTGPDPEHYRVADVALTRVAPEGRLVVNSSQGGGGKDTWIVGAASTAGSEED
ncbi:carboxylate-amine ligase [Glaciihabitans tibetensis]|uniref:Putative glutamate--cysteine ligase 2 n=1 Tax=Glaciihabitans tibetensis TaxID=1266600 RepID=A0A2T0VGS9_9MICO|nr:carboxylate--amine ligase/circularly permuted type 2 ATP-grasp protein [Glaciihabitans tibetensis]PRY69385.1 carboxylate-amine ligase [Glaciihabitans tibetensis]